MALGVPAFKFSVNGVRSGGEIWSTAFWAGSETLSAPTEGEMNAHAQTVYNLWLAEVWTPSTTLISVSTSLVDVKSYWYPSGGNLATSIGQHSAAPVAGTASAADVNPYQCGIVVSLRTPSATRRGRGRMYLPFDAVTMSLAGQYAAGEPVIVADNMRDFFNAYNDAATLNTQLGNAGVASQADGDIKELTKIVVDSVPDIQRRRSNALVPVTVAQRDITP